MEAHLPLLADALQIESEPFPGRHALHSLGWTGVDALVRGGEGSLVVFLLLGELVLLLLLDELAVLLDLLFHAENLDVDRGELFPEALVFKDLLVDLSHDLLLTLEALLVGQEHFEERKEGRSILGVELHAEGIKAVLSPLEARPQLFIVSLQQLYIGACWYW